MKRYWAGGTHNRKTGFQRKRLGTYRSEKTRRGQSTAAARKEDTAANREVRKSVKTYKRYFVEGLTEEAERAAASRNMKQLYDTTKKLAGQFKKSERPIRDKNGTVLTGVDKQINGWAEHFGELLNRLRPQNQPDIQPAEEDILINCNKPTRDNIQLDIFNMEKQQDLMVFQQKH